MFYEPVANGYVLRVRVTPNSSKCAVLGLFTDASGLNYLKISLTSVPEKGKANSELIKYLGKMLKQSKSSFIILNGETDRFKRLLLQAEPSEEMENSLKQMGQTT